MGYISLAEFEGQSEKENEKEEKDHELPCRLDDERLMYRRTGALFGLPFCLLSSYNSPITLYPAKTL